MSLFDQYTWDASVNPRFSQAVEQLLGDNRKAFAEIGITSPSQIKSIPFMVKRGILPTDDWQGVVGNEGVSDSDKRIKQYAHLFSQKGNITRAMANQWIEEHGAGKPLTEFPIGNSKPSTPSQVLDETLNAQAAGNAADVSARMETVKNGFVARSDQTIQVAPGKPVTTVQGGAANRALTTDEILAIQKQWAEGGTAAADIPSERALTTIERRVAGATETPVSTGTTQQRVASDYLPADHTTSDVPLNIQPKPQRGVPLKLEPKPARIASGGGATPPPSGGSAPPVMDAEPPATTGRVAQGTADVQAFSPMSDRQARRVRPMGPASELPRKGGFLGWGGVHEMKDHETIHEKGSVGAGQLSSDARNRIASMGDEDVLRMMDPTTGRFTAEGLHSAGLIKAPLNALGRLGRAVRTEGPWAAAFIGLDLAMRGQAVQDMEDQGYTVKQAGTVENARIAGNFLGNVIPAAGLALAGITNPWIAIPAMIAGGVGTSLLGEAIGKGIAGAPSEKELLRRQALAEPLGVRPSEVPQAELRARYGLSPSGTKRFPDYIW